MSPTLFSALYLAPAGLAFLAWFACEALARRVEPRSGVRLRLWRCEICTYEYVDSVSKEFSPCPRCNSLNRRTWGGTT